MGPILKEEQSIMLLFSTFINSKLELKLETLYIEKYKLWTLMKVLL